MKRMVVVGHADINQMLQREVTQKRDTMQTGTASDLTLNIQCMCEFDEVYICMMR